MKFPPQHGAWAFLIVPTVMALFLGAGNWLGWVFLLTWIGAYPFTYFASRAVIARVRRGAWTSKATKELRSAFEWSFIALAGSIILIVNRPWIVFSGGVVILIWGLSTYLSWAGHERGISNDILLIALASAAPVLMYQVANDEKSFGEVPHAIWIASLLSLLYFFGSVLHVKALIREAKNPLWHRGSVLFHALVVAGLLFSSQTSWLALPFILGLIRTTVMKPGLKPGRIGIIEGSVALALVICTVIAVSS
ncbi:MAG: YwiC-like family protein [Candidatus Nanopelagicaceae bacterium]|nr:YwiC-like family protein [Candidatus Nanopelagicaceae bacterium]